MTTYAPKHTDVQVVLSGEEPAEEIIKVVLLELRKAGHNEGSVQFFLEAMPLLDSGDKDALLALVLATVDVVTEKEKLGTYFVTFGNLYRHEAHPVLPGAHPDGWLELRGMTYADALQTALRLTDGGYSSIYEEAEFETMKHHYPRGAMFRFTKV